MPSDVTEGTRRECASFVELLRLRLCGLRVFQALENCFSFLLLPLPNKFKIEVPHARNNRIDLGEQTTHRLS